MQTPSGYPPPLPSPSVYPPSVPVPPPAPRGRAMIWLVATLGLVVGILVVVAIVLGRRVASHGSTARSIVRIVLPTGSGTGFFVAGPDANAYVVTANHVVDSGDRILVERTVDGPNGRQWTEAYPDAEVVAFDADADLAVIRLNG